MGEHINQTESGGFDIKDNEHFVVTSCGEIFGCFVERGGLLKMNFIFGEL